MQHRPKTCVPHRDVYAEALRLIAAAATAGLTLRLLGGVAVRHRCPSIAHPQLHRTYKDIDLVGRAAQRADIERLFSEQGYTPKREFNLLNGSTRLLFHDDAHDRHLDIFLDHFRMCHTFDLRERLAVAQITLAPADLLLTKLQVVQATENDLCDTYALLADLPLGTGADAIDAAYIAQLAAQDWGLHHTLNRSLDRLAQWAIAVPPIGTFTLTGQIAQLRAALNAAPKTLAWKLRARVGERVRWYELPEEVES